ncbi:MAG TPA: O-antigen ligase family protein [Gaiellaceae bacterium]|jgi:O-antigen ligase
MSEALTSHLALTRSRALAGDWRTRLVAVAAFVSVAGLASSNGGYYETTWNWAALAFAWAATIALVVGERFALSRLELATVGMLLAYAGWVALSILWTDSVPAPVREVQRDLVYPAGMLAALLVLRRERVRSFLGGVWAGITIVSWYGLSTRIFPDQLTTFDPISVYRLKGPIGYWNGFGIFTAVGIVLALGFVARGTHWVTRVLAAASLVVLGPALYFTYGRGVWIALVCGLVVAFALDPRRLQLITTTLLVGAPTITAVWIGSQFDGLTQVGASLANARHDGHQFALALMLLAVIAAALVWGRDQVVSRVEFGSGIRRGYALALIAAVAGALALTFAHYGGPSSITRRAWAAFSAPPITSTNLNARLFTLSSNGRIDEWTQAWHDYTKHPVLGSGAGTYEIWWLQHRTTDLKVRDAHSLYIEALAELGPVGLLIIVLAFCLPLAAAIRARAHPLVPIATGAYFAFIVHAGVDWDWELSGVTLTGLFCGAAVLAAARDEVTAAPRAVVRWIALAMSVGVAGIAIVGLLGNIPASRSADAIQSRAWTRAATEARREIRWAPWSADGWRRLGQAEVGQNKLVVAERNLLKAIAKDPNNWDRWFDLALATTGATQRHALERALALNPRSPEIRQFVAGIGLKGVRFPQKGNG